MRGDAEARMKLRSATTRPPRQAGRSTRGFTIVELLMVIIIIAVLAAVIVVAGRRALGIGRTAAQAQTVAGIKSAVEQFRQEFGFLPPLLQDEPIPGLNRPGISTFPVFVNGSTGERQLAVMPVSLAPNNAGVREYLRGYASDGSRLSANPHESSNADLRFSTTSLPTYLMGQGDAALRPGEDGRDDALVLDGARGPAIGKPSDNGTFEQSAGGRQGKSYGPYVDPAGSLGLKLVSQELDGGGPGKKGVYQLQARDGTPIRYYRWLRGRRNETTEVLNEGGRFEPDYLNIPGLVGNADDPSLRSADFAIVAAGGDGVFGDLNGEGRDPGGGPLVQSRVEELYRKLGLVLPVNWANPPAGDVEQFNRAARRDNVVEVGR